MTTDLARSPSTPAGPAFDEQSLRYAAQSRAPNTLRAYEADWGHFTAWCVQADVDPLPATPATIARYLTAYAETLRPSTLNRRLSTIAQAHRLAGYPTPTADERVRSVLKGIRRTRGTLQDAKAPATTDVLRTMVESLGDSLRDLRDRALLLIGFAGAFRRAELVALTCADVEQTRQGLVITLTRSKTDQEGAGTKKGIPYGSHPDTCPVRALQHWLEIAPIREGALFRAIDRHNNVASSALSGNAVALIVKRAAEAAGLDPALFAGHSLRAGLATSAIAAGVSERDTMRQTGHRSRAVFDRYVREGELFRNNPAARVGL